MSRLNELISAFCPRGVEFKTIGSLVNYERPDRYIVNDTNYDDEYGTPVLTAGKSFILGYTYETENIYQASKDEPVIIFDDFTGAFKWVDFPFKVKSSAMKILKSDDITLLKYIFYVMGRINFTSSEHKRLWISIYSKFSIPLPPLEVQQEIVNILDKFTKIEAELEAELEARKKQYEFYRDRLLTFGSDMKTATLGDVIFSLNTGLNPRKFFKLNTDDAENYYITIREIQNGQIIPTDRTDRINDEALRLCNNRSNLEAGDVLFSGTGTIGETAVINETPANWNIKEGIYTIKPNPKYLNSKFLRYLLTTQAMKNKYMKKAAGGTVKSVPMQEVRNLTIPLPPLEVQQKIVDVLDKFNSLCSDLTAGLPAEINARRRQYEYYRDKLLSFEDVS